MAEADCECDGRQRISYGLHALLVVISLMWVGVIDAFMIASLVIPTYVVTESICSKSARIVFWIVRYTTRKTQ